ncbi:MAG: zf-HC2 domain-containing protein [Burkholderiaceae bacterium]
MNDERFEELLPFYVNGTLEGEDRAFVERHIAEHPEARAEVDWYRSLQLRVRENAPAVPETIGMARTMQLIQGDRPTLSERISAFFGNFGMRPAMALAGLAVVAVQSGVILDMMYGAKENEAEIRSLRATQVEEGPLLKINFAPEAKEVDMRLMLASVQGQLAGGPGQLGDYYVRVPEGRQQAALEQLKSNPLVQSAALSAGVPSRD